MLHQIYDCQCTTWRKRTIMLVTLIICSITNSLINGLIWWKQVTIIETWQQYCLPEKNFPKVKVIKYYNHLSNKSTSRLCYNVRLQSIKLFWTTNQCNCCATILWKCHPAVFSLFSESSFIKLNNFITKSQY